MKDDELRAYIGQWVEIELDDGETYAGRLVAGEKRAAGARFVLVQPSAGPNEEPPQVAIAEASSVVAVRSVVAPPETFD